MLAREMKSDHLSTTEKALMHDNEFRKCEALHKRLQTRQKLGRARERELSVRQVGETQADEEEGRIFTECVRILHTNLESGYLREAEGITRQYVEAEVKSITSYIETKTFTTDEQVKIEDFKQMTLQANKTLVDDDYEFEYAVRFLCGERNTPAIQLVEWFVRRREEQLCEPSEGEPASAKDVEDLIQERAQARIQMLQSEHFVRKIARETAYKPIEQAAATAEISESMAEKLRPKVVAMIAAGRERAEIHADADECRAKVQSAKPGSVEYKECFPRLKGRPDEGGAGGLEGKLKAASAKFDDALREVLKIADAQTSTWGRQVMMEVLREEVEKLREEVEK